MSTPMGSGPDTGIRSGRGSFPGPMTGGYLSFGMAGGAEASAWNGADRLDFVMEMPCAFRVEAISYHARNVTDVVSFQVGNSTTAIWTGVTDMISADVTIETGDNGLITATSTPSLVAAARDMAKGSFLIIGLTGDAAGAYGDLTVMVHGYVQDHINADPADD